MEQAIHIVSCPFCQGDNSPRSLRCRSCGETLVASLVVAGVVEPELARMLATRLAERPGQIPRLEQKLLAGRGVLIRELSAGRAQKLALEARRDGILLEVRPLRMLAPPPEEGAELPSKARRIRATVILSGLALLVGLVGFFLYRTATQAPLDAGSGWRSATIRAGRILPDFASPVPPSASAVAPLSIPLPAAPHIIEPSVVQAVMPAMVRIQTLQGVGSGFFVDPSGLIVTTYHQVQQGGPIQVTAEGETRLARIERLSPAWDLALLRIDATAAPALSLANGAELQVLTPVFSVGLADGMPGSVRSGRVSYVGRSLDAAAMLELDLPVHSDHAGAPVMDAEGRVVGVVSAIKTSSARTSYAVLSNYLFDGEDALLRGFLPIQALSDHFLRLQLKSLAEVGTRLRERRAGLSSQAFVTTAGTLALVLDADRPDTPQSQVIRSPSQDKDDVQVELWLRSEEGQPLLHRIDLAHVAFATPQAEHGGVYLTVPLEPEVHQYLQRVHRAKVEVSVPELGLHQVLRLSSVPL